MSFTYNAHTGLWRWFCARCEARYEQWGPWGLPTPEHKKAMEAAERQHDWDWHTPQVLKDAWGLTEGRPGGRRMSYVTEVVAILANREQGRRFEDLINQLGGVRPRPTPVESGGPNATSVFVYVLGLDYMNPELVEILTTEPWATGSVIWIEDESWDDPMVKVFS